MTFKGAAFFGPLSLRGSELKPRPYTTFSLGKAMPILRS
jgi:hypothetical protein